MSDKINMKTFYVVYQDYTEYNQFEGSYDWTVDEFQSFDEANDFVNNLKKGIPSGSVRDILGPLVKVNKS